MNNVGFKQCDFSGLPEEVRQGVDEYCRLAGEIMGAFPVPEDLIKSYAFCRAPLEVYFSAEGGASCLN